MGSSSSPNPKVATTYCYLLLGPKQLKLDTVCTVLPGVALLVLYCPNKANIYGSYARSTIKINGQASY